MTHPGDSSIAGIAPPGSTLYYSLMGQSSTQKALLLTLYALQGTLTGIIQDCHEPDIAMSKLGWWRDEIKRLFAGQALHPLTRNLTASLNQHNLQQSLFTEMLDGVEMLLEQGSFQTFSELQLYCYRVGSALQLLAAEIGGYQQRHSLSAAHDLGIAMELTRLLLQMRANATRGLVLFPADELREHRLTLADFSTPTSHDRLQRFFSQQVQRAETFFTRALTQIPETDRYHQRHAIILANLNLALLQEVRRDGFRLQEQRLDLTPLRKFWIAWRSLRQEKKYAHNTSDR